MHEKKNFSHGRFVNYENRSNNINIYLRTKEVSKYEKELLDYIKDGKNIIIKSRFNGISAEFDLLIMSQYIIYYISKLLNIDMSKPSFAEDTLKLYFYKGEL